MRNPAWQETQHRLPTTFCQDRLLVCRYVISSAAKTSGPNMKQIGFIILAMIVTRSSALSLQAKLGLPRGNQLVGWAVLGKFF